MTMIGFALSSEEHRPRDMVRFAALGEELGLPTCWVTDHFHPWVDAQGNSPFVWSVIGGIASATEKLRVGTGVTCPTIRIHPAIIAQAAATSADMLPGRFFLGVGSGENLNEHILGDRWPPAGIRLEMLEEAVEVMRKLWEGDEVTHYGKHYTVENARLYTVPDELPPIYVSAFGPKAVELAARVGDGYVNTSPDPEPLQRYREQGGKGPSLVGPKVCWGEDEQQCRKMAFELWPNSGLSGELAQELRTPKHFEQASSVLEESDVADSLPCGPDPEKHVESLKQYLDAGYDELYVTQIGPEQEGFLRFLAKEVVPRLGV